jgi:hypothetical protein
VIAHKDDFTEHLVTRLDHELRNNLPQDASTTKMLLNAQAIINTFIAHVIVRIQENISTEQFSQQEVTTSK